MKQREYSRKMQVNIPFFIKRAAPVALQYLPRIS
jgi:hypothetical protein